MVLWYSKIGLDVRKLLGKMAVKDEGEEAGVSGKPFILQGKTGTCETRHEMKKEQVRETHLHQGHKNVVARPMRSP